MKFEVWEEQITLNSPTVNSMKILKIVFILIVQVSSTCGQKQSSAQGSGHAVIYTGAERMELYLPLLKGKSVAIFANQASVVGKSMLVDSLLASGITISKIFSPEHGFRGTADAGE